MADAGTDLGDNTQLESTELMIDWSSSRHFNKISTAGLLEWSDVLSIYLGDGHLTGDYKNRQRTNPLTQLGD